MYSKGKFTCYSRYLLTSSFCIPISYEEKASFLSISSRRSCGSSLELFSFFCIGGCSIDLGYSDIEWFTLEMDIDHSVIFENAPKYCILDSFVDYEDYSISSKGFLFTVVDIMVICIKFTLSVHFSSLIPKMLMFTLAISCLTTSNLPWFVDLRFQIPMQYCSL